MSAQILTLLKFGLLALLYLFFARVLFSVWAELRPTGKWATAPAPAQAAPTAPPAQEPTSRPQRGAERRARHKTDVAQVSPATTYSRNAPPGVGPDPFSPPPGPTALPQGQLLVTEPENLAGLTYELGTELTVGRAPGCGISLDDTFVSSLHARIFRHEGAYVLEDLGSTNGTFLNGSKVTEPVIIRMSDTIRFGSMQLVLR